MGKLLKLTPSELASWKAAAAERGVALSDLIREAVSEKLARCEGGAGDVLAGLADRYRSRPARPLTRSETDEQRELRLRRERVLAELGQKLGRA